MFKTINARLFLVTAAFFVAAGCVIVALVNYQMRKEALWEAEAKAETLLDRNLAIHTYFSHKLKPNLFDITDEIMPASYFDPVWMSSTYAVREIQKYYMELSRRDYYYKECAIDARSPENEADPMEIEFIKEINRNANIDFRSDIRLINGEPYFVVLRRGEVMEESCLRCHSRPENAPADLVKQYGAERSFNRNTGDVVSAISIRIPLASAYAEANRFSLTLSLWLCAVLIGLYIINWVASRALVLRPLQSIQGQVDAIMSHPERLGEQVAMPHGKELKDLTAAFNRLSLDLRRERDLLEDKVEQRTLQLKSANDELSREIAERGKALQRAEENEKKYRELFTHLPEGFAYQQIVTDPDGNPTDYVILECNQAFAEAAGVRDAAIIGRRAGEVFSAGGLWESGWIERFGEVALLGNAIGFEHHLQNSERCYRVIAYSPKRSYFACIFSDISQRVRMEKQLESQKEYLRVTLASIGDGVITTDVDGRVTLLNKVAEELTGWLQQDALGRPLSEVFHIVNQKTRERCEDPAWKVLESGGIVGLANDTVLISRNGKEYVIADSGSPIRDRRGQVIGVVLIFRDVTERYQMEAELRHAHKMQAIGTLAGGVAHEFNNVLGVIIGNAELGMSDLPEGNPLRRNLTEIKTAGLRAKDVVKQLLNFSRKVETKTKPIRLAPVIQESLQLMRASIPKTIDIKAVIQDKAHAVLADSTQIHQLLVNLCTNAAHAMGEAGGVLTIQLENVELDHEEASKHADLYAGIYVRLSVADTGCGIDPAHLDRIFEPYFTTKEIGKGTGMGLAVVHGIVRSGGGAIVVDSELHRGTVVTVLLPAAKNAAVEEVQEKKTIPGGNEKILFVDDEESLARLGELLLTRLGYRVETETDPLQALQRFKSSPAAYDLVISDMTMPGMTGDVLSAELLKIRPDIRIILCSGFSEQIDQTKAQAMGIHEYLEKPINLEKIACMVRRVLDAARDGGSTN